MSRARAAPGHRGARATSLGAGTERARRLHMALAMMGQRPGTLRSGHRLGLGLRGQQGNANPCFWGVHDVDRSLTRDSSREMRQSQLYREG